MGYTTWFRGRFELDEPLTVEQVAALKALYDNDDLREGSDLGDGFKAPGNYCQWRVSKDGRGLEWDEGEKFYKYVAWLEVLIGRYLQPWGRVLTGKVEWYGEEPSDQGVIHVLGNRVQAIKNVIVRPDPQVIQPDPDWSAR